MRTTITLGDAILKAAKRRASERNVTLSKVIEDALREHLVDSTPRRPRFKLITAGRRGAQPGVDLDRSSELLDETDLGGLGGRRGAR